MLKDTGNFLLTCGLIIFFWWVFDFSPARIVRKILFNTPISYTPESFLGMVFMGVIDILSWLIVLIPLIVVMRNIFK